MDYSLRCEKLLATLAANLTKWATILGLSNRELARLSTLKESTIRSIKKGQKNIQIESLIKLRLTFSVTIRDLLTKTVATPRLVTVPLTETTSNKECQLEIQRIGKRILNIIHENKIDPASLSILASNSDYSDTLKYLKGSINLTLITVLKYAAGLKVNEWKLLEDF